MSEELTGDVHHTGLRTYGDDSNPRIFAMSESKAKALWNAILEFTDSAIWLQSELSSEFYDEKTATKHQKDVILHLEGLIKEFKNTGFTPRCRKKSNEIEVIVKTHNWEIK